MRKTWRATCLGLMVLAPLLTACSGDDEPTEKSSATSSAPLPPGEYGEPVDPDAGNPDEVATDPTAPPVAEGDEVTPQLTYFGWNADIGAVDAGGIIPGIVESDGTCTLTLSQGSTEVSASSAAVDNVTSTSCAEMVITGDRLSPGAWQATLSYESTTAQGTSGAVEVVVP